MKKKIEDYILKKYNICPAKPWKAYPEYETFTDLYTDKWFAVIMDVEYKKLGMEDEGRCWIINVKADPDFIAFIGGIEGYKPAYHMHKGNWVTLLLDGSLDFEEVCDRIDGSYSLVSNTPTRRIYEAVKRIPHGKVATYKTVAAMAGEPKMARAVGNALHKNPEPSTIPCFRVVNSKGELSGNFAFGGPGGQARLLEKDGIPVVDGKVDLSVYGYLPDDLFKEENKKI